MNPLSASYFQQLQQALTDAGLAEPVLVIDRDRLDTNIAALKAMLPEGMAYRIVAKSLPCAELLEYVAAQTETHRLMSFQYQHGHAAPCANAPGQSVAWQADSSAGAEENARWG